MSSACRAKRKASLARFRRSCSPGSPSCSPGSAIQGLDDLRHAVEGARRFGQLDRLMAAGPRIADELRAAGFASEAEAFLDSLGPAGALPSSSGSAAARPPRLPPKCPSCGGIVHPGEVEWADERSVLCDYCGSVIPGEEG